MAPVNNSASDSCDASNWMFLARVLCYLMLFCFFMSVLANMPMGERSGECKCKRDRMRYIEGMDNIPFSELNAAVPLVKFDSIELTAPANTDTLLTGMAYIYDDNIMIDAFLPIIDGAVFHPLKGAVSYNAYVENASGKQLIGQFSRDGDKVYKVKGKFDKKDSSKTIVIVTKKEDDKEDVILIGGR